MNLGGFLQLLVTAACMAVANVLMKNSWFQNLFDARRKIAAWRKEYNEERPQQPGIPNFKRVCCC